MDTREFNNWTAQMAKLTDAQLRTLRDLCEEFIAERQRKDACQDVVASMHNVNRGAW